MVSVINKSTVVTDGELGRIVELANLVMERDFAPAYERLFGPRHWQHKVGGNDRIVHTIVDHDRDVPGALAWHDLQNGRPVAVTMAAEVLDSGATMFGEDGVLSAFLHEAEETFNDAACNLIARGPDGKYRWREVCDATQGTDYEIDPGSGVYAPNYCKPHWFNPDSPDDDLDYQGACTRPFEVLRHGYQVVSSCDDGTQVSAPGEKPQGHLEDRDGNQVDGGPNAWRTLYFTGI